MEPDSSSEILNTFNQLFLVRPNKLLVNLRPHERRGGISDSHNVRAGVYLFPRKPKLHFNHESEQVPDEYRVVIEIQHDRINPPQVGRLSNWSLYPTFDNHVSANSFF